MAATLFTNIRQLVNIREEDQLLRGKALAYLPVLKNAYLMVENGIIAAYGLMDELPESLTVVEEIVDASGQMILPCWCDSHTHLVFAASREEEFVDKIKGLSYAEIAARGGGILNSAQKLNDTSESELIRMAWNRIQELIRLGTGAVEIKSGYGLSVEGVYVFASIRDSVYRFTETSVIRDFSYLKLLELRDEDKFNTNRELNISETGWSYWFYKPDTTEHPFNRKVTRLDSGRVICTKVIRQLYNVGEGKVVKLRDVNTPLYLFIVAVSEYDENGQPKGELIRRKLKIEWEDD